MSHKDLDSLLRDQDGVVACFQVLEAGLGHDFIRSRLRRREWVRVHRRVYINHTGPPTWRQRAWAAVLHCWPAALADESVLVACGLGPQEPAGPPSDGRPIHVAVEHTRRLAKTEGISLRPIVDLAGHVLANVCPPRLRLEDALVRVASRQRTEEGAIACLANGCQSHRTSPQRLVGALRDHIRLPGREFLLEVMEDVATGAYSVLEHRYLTRVERPHGLPTARRQRRVRPGRSPAYRDVEYLGIGLVVELDGRLGHELALDRWDDFDRDIESLVAGDTTVRVGWGQVLSPCRLTVALVRIMRALGWRGSPKPCGPACPVGALVRTGASGANRGAPSPNSAHAAPVSPRARTTRGVRTHRAPR